MEVSGQLHAPATLPQGKKPSVPIGQEAGWALGAGLDAVVKEKTPAPAGNQPPVVQSAA